MTSSPAFEAERLIWRFRRSGTPGAITRPFAELDPGRQAAVLGVAALLAEEVPAIICWFDESRWVLLTSARLMWLSEGRLDAILSSEIIRASTGPETVQDAHARHVAKDGFRILVVETQAARHLIELEPGGPFFGFLNAVMAAAP